MAGTSQTPRVVALVGPQSSGKTTLLESMLCRCGTLDRRAANGSRLIGDGSAEAKARNMGTETNVASGTFMGDPYVFLDCPGSVELMQETFGALNGTDLAIIVTESDRSKIIGLAPLLKLLEDLDVPHFIFVNKIDKAEGSIRDLAASLKQVSQKPVVLRHIPIRDGDTVSGYVDLAHKRAYVYRKGQESEIIDLPSDLEEDVANARFSMLETLADFDEHLMEELLEDIDPPRDEVLKDLASDVGEDLIMPVLIGSALNENGVHRVLKALRHETPQVARTIEHLGLITEGDTAAVHILKTYYQPHIGKVSLARVLNGSVKDGDSLNGERVSGLFRIMGEKLDKLDRAHIGDVVGLGRLEDAKTGDLLFAGKSDKEKVDAFSILPPVYTLALTAANRNDEVKLITSLTKLCEEDPSLSYEQTADTHEILLRGQGEVHLQLAIERLKSKFGVSVSKAAPKVPYKETIKKPKKQHSRYKKQSGGHGQFGDVVVEVQPLPLGSGFNFKDTITGGAIPKQYIPSVEAGVKDYMSTGPLGFPVVDVGVTLVDGSYHTVDSSDMAFKTAGRLAMSEALPDCSPVLLEPIMHVKIMTPSDYTGQANSAISSRRGQILGFDAREGWPGWDVVEAHIPQSEMQDLIVELRSTTLGSATFVAEYDHLSELTGRLATQVLQQHAAE